MTLVDQRALAALLQSQDYTFAKTLAHNPHHYVPRQKWRGPEGSFEETCLAIRALGTVRRFGNRDYIQWYANGWFWWDMGDPLDKVTIINRKPFRSERLNPPCPYDHAATYDDLYATSECLAEEEELTRLLRPLIDDAPRIIDIGCGTGLLLDLFPDAAAKYIGVDVSPTMLTTAAAKHPDAEFMHCAAEDVWLHDDDALIVALFGSASYPQPWTWQRWADNRCWLMGYTNGYRPVTATLPGYDRVRTWQLADATSQLFGKYDVVSR